MRCVRPGVPGMAQLRASVFSSRRKGWKPSRLGAELHLDLGQLADVRDAPGLGAVGEVAVGEQDHRRHVLEREAHGLDRHVEAVARASRPRARTAALRCCGRRRPAADRPARSWSAGPCSARRAECRRSRAAARRRRRGRCASILSAMPGPLVLVTPSLPAYDAPIAEQIAAISSSAWIVRHAELLVLAELVQDVARRRDRVSAEHERQPDSCEAAIRPERRRGVAADVAVHALFDRGGRHLVAVLRDLADLAEGVAGLERRDVGLRRAPGACRTCSRST